MIGNQRINTAMVLAAGRGERMRPLSDAVPKPALPLVREPVVGSPIRLARTAGAERVVVNTWHLAAIMERALGEVGVDVAVSREETLMGTAGGIALARDRGLLADRGPLLVVNGDGVLNVDLGPLVERAATGHDLVTLALLPHLDPSRWSRVVLDSKGRVVRIIAPGVPEPDEVPLLYPGVMVVSRAALDHLEAGAGDIPSRLWGPALAAGRLGGVLVSGHWREVGTPAEYLETVLGKLQESSVVHASAVIHTSASVHAALVGREARIGAGAVVHQAVVAEGAEVGPGSRVVRSALFGGTATRAGEVVSGEFRAVRR